jgi:16S rRNA (cytidine1402-2'-O)-methyltransferase
MFEEAHRGTISTAIERFAAVKAKGEITLIVEAEQSPTVEHSDEEIRAALREAIASGKTKRDAVHEVAERYPIPKKEVYRIMIEMKGESADEA